MLLIYLSRGEFNLFKASLGGGLFKFGLDLILLNYDYVLFLACGKLGEVLKKLEVVWEYCIVRLGETSYSF